MNERDTSWSTSLGTIWPTIAILAAAVFGAMLWQSSLESARPSIGSPTDKPPSSIGIDAEYSRLWQDPLEFGEEAAPEPTGSFLLELVRQAKQKQQATKALDNVHQVMAAILANANNPCGDRKAPLRPGLHVIPILLPGGPYPMEHEVRMRMRYAVIQGLAVNDYSPTLQTRMSSVNVRINVCLRATGEKTKITLRVPFKLYQPCTRKGVKVESQPDVLVLWVNESRLGNQPLGAIKQILAYLFALSPDDPRPASLDHVRVSIIGPTSSDALYDFYQGAIEGESPERSHKRAETSSRAPPDAKAELKDCYFGTGDFEHFQIFSPRATVPEEFMPQPVNDDAALPPSICRTIGDDRTLIARLWQELQLRQSRNRTGWPSRLFNRPRHVVIVTEADTFYARTMQEICEDVIGSTSSAPVTLHFYTYLRGLDGKTGKGDRSSAAAKGTSYPHDEGKSDQGRLGLNSEAYTALPQGMAQIDYLERIGERVRALDRRLDQSGDGRITAVGVLGTDIYDKLLILRALRRGLPHADFFTTDLDAALFNTSELPTTRNLLVASHFGLYLNPLAMSCERCGCNPEHLNLESHKLKVSPPVFRDSYQTSLFYTMLIVLDHPLKQRLHCIDNHHDDAAAESSHSQGELILDPVLLEIGRRDPYYFLPNTVASADRVSANSANADERHKRIDRYRIVQPQNPQDMATLGEKWARRLLLLVGLAAAWSCACLAHHGLRHATYKALQPFVHVVSWIGRVGEPAALWERALAFGTVSVIAFLVWVIVYHDFDTSNEPILWLMGVSTWPATFLRLAAACFAVGCLFRVRLQIQELISDVTNKFGLTSGQQRNADSGGERGQAAQALGGRSLFRAMKQGILRCWSWLQMACRSPEGTESRNREEVDGVQVQELWSQFLSLNALGRTVRCVTMAAVLYVFITFIAMRLTGFPSNPTRGHTDSVVSFLVLMAAVLSLSGLLFLVLRMIENVKWLSSSLLAAPSIWSPSQAGFDASMKFVPQSKRNSPEQGAEPVEAAGAELPQEITRELLDIELNALLTVNVGKLILYPFVVLFLMIIARSSLFDYQDLSPTLLSIICIGLALILYESISLRHVAQQGKRVTLRRLQQGLAQASQKDAEGASDKLLVRQYAQAIKQVQQENRGAFRYFLMDPAIRALLIPLGGVSGVFLAEQLGHWFLF